MDILESLSLPLPRHGLAFQFLQKFRDTVLQPSVVDVRQFFTLVASVAHEVFGTTMVTIWDNNGYSRSLVLQASHPDPALPHAHSTMSRDQSFTGLVLVNGDIVQFRELNTAIGGRYFHDPHTIQDIENTSLVSIPVTSPYNSQLVVFVVNLYFNNRDSSPTIDPATGDWLGSVLSLSLDYLLYKIEDDVRHAVENLSGDAVSGAAMFDELLGQISAFMKGSEVSILSCGAKTEIDSCDTLVLEATTALDLKDHQKGKHFQKNDLPLSLCLLHGECIQKGRPAMLHEDLQTAGELASSERRRWPHTAVPIRSLATGKVIGLIHCYQTGGAESAASFTSLDVHTLESFARAISPAFERLLHLRSGSSLLDVVKQVADRISPPYDLPNILQHTIEAAVASMGATVGSIFLYDESDPDVLVMQAGTEKNRELIGKAKYARGEGITGAIGNGKIKHFHSRESMVEDSEWVGKYERDIWGSAQAPNSFLGVPIRSKTRILGVWKMANIAPHTEHPDARFTDEDKAIVTVLCAFLASAIEIHHQRDKDNARFRHLAQNTIAIEEAENNREACQAILGALTEAHIGEGMVSLYDPKNHTIHGFMASNQIWNATISSPPIDLRDSNTLARVLSRNQPEFIVNQKENVDLTDEGSILVINKAQYILPLRVGGDLLGIIQIDLGEVNTLDADTELICKAFAGHLALALARIRRRDELSELTYQLAYDSKRSTLSALSMMVIHNSRARASDIAQNFIQHYESNDDISKEVLGSWQTNIASLEEYLKNALSILGGQQNLEEGCADMHKHIEQWSTVIRTLFPKDSSKHLPIQLQLDAADPRCRMSYGVLEVLLDEFLLNSYKAGAQNVAIRTYNRSKIEHPTGNWIESALCVEFQDDGQGIAAENLPRIFDLFYSSDPLKEAAGVGLHGSRLLARENGGDLFATIPGAEKELGKDDGNSTGVTFHLILPNSA